MHRWSLMFTDSYHPAEPPVWCWVEGSRHSRAFRRLYSDTIFLIPPSVFRHLWWLGFQMRIKWGFLQMGLLLTHRSWVSMGILLNCGSECLMLWLSTLNIIGTNENIKGNITNLIWYGRVWKWRIYQPTLIWTGKTFYHSAMLGRPEKGRWSNGI